MNDLETAVQIAKSVTEAGGKAYFVGGFVRDTLLGRNPSEIKDIDIEVHRIEPRKLKQILSSMGTLVETGKSFGIYGLAGCGLDIAVPRKEHATGAGHKDFEIYTDPYIGTEGAAKRRDFTVNALMQDILTGEIVDHFNGMADLRNKVLRHVNDETFSEDPLRVLRLAQFAARFGFTPFEGTIDLCRKISLSELSKERVYDELMKALLYSEKPSVFFKVLKDAEGLSFWFPELEALSGVPQPVKYHPEGDAFVHTLCVLDKGAACRDKTQKPDAFMLAALCHDFGKALCTEYESGNYHAIGHETAGLPVAEEFLRRITSNKAIIRYVLNMVKLHMKPNISAGANSSVKTTNKMFDESLQPEDLILLALSDITCSPENDSEAAVRANKAFLESRLQIYREYMSRPQVTGSDLLEAGFLPDKKFSEYLDMAHARSLSGVPKETIMKELTSLYKKEKQNFT